jgi:hypothetical protein
MLQVRPGFFEGRKRELPGHMTVSETLNLRKDEPHPMARLASIAQFGTHLIIDRILRVHETLEIVGIFHKSS